MNEIVIKTDGLTRYFGPTPAVRDLNLEVLRGSVFAFIGRNGSGKSTTIKMLMGLLPATRGTAAILGCDSRMLTPEVRARVGYLAEEHPVYDWMSVRQAEDFQKSFFPRWNGKIFKEVADHFELRSNSKVRQLSRGERAGLSLALTLAPDPELLILDDPAMGLDPVARRRLVESMIYLTRQQTRTIFFSSHEIADVERVADWIGVLDHGSLSACCRVETFRNRVCQVRLFFDQDPPAIPPVRGVLRVSRFERELRLLCVQTNSSFEHQFSGLGARRVESTAVSFEDALIAYLGERGERPFFSNQPEVRP